MDYSASSIAARQKGKRVLRRFEAFNSTILVYDASLPVRHKATIPHFLDLMRRPLSNAELGRRLGAFISQRCRSLGKLSFKDSSQLAFPYHALVLLTWAAAPLAFLGSAVWSQGSNLSNIS